MSAGLSGKRRLLGGLLGELAAGVAACRASEQGTAHERADLSGLAAELDACGAEAWEAAAVSAGLEAGPGNRDRIVRRLRLAAGRG